MPPIKIMDQGPLSPFSLHSEASSLFSEELHVASEKQVGFWKSDPVSDHEGRQLTLGIKPVSSSFDKLHKIRSSHMECSGYSKSFIVNDHQTNMMEPQKMTSISTISRVTDHVSRSQFNMFTFPTSLSGEGNIMSPSGADHENGLFSSSFPDIFDKKLRLSPNIVPLGQSVDSVNSNFGEDEPFQSMEEIEAQTIGNLLPDDDDLLSGVIDDIGFIGQSNEGNDIDDDLFYSGGGLELETDDNLNGNNTSESIERGVSNGQQGLSGPFSSEHPYGEHPSRTLFVRNINSNVEDAELRALFEKYGDIRTLYTACKHRGFVMISYYDIRAAQNAMLALQSKSLRRRKLDIHFSIPKDNPSEKDINQGTLLVFNLDPSVTHDNLHQIFSVYGEIKEIRETLHKHHHRSIEFYDVRAAEVSLCALNGSDIAGKKINLELTHHGGARQCLMQQLFPELEQKELNGFCQSRPNKSLSGCPGCFGSPSFGAITSNSLEDGSIHDFKSAIRSPIVPHMEAKFHGISSSMPQNLSSPVNIASVANKANQAAHAEASHSLGQMNFGFQDMPSFHPHSLPDFHHRVTNGIPFNSNTMGAIGVGVISRPVDGNNKRNLHRVSSGSFGGHSTDSNEAFGLPTNGSCSLHGHQHSWTNANAAYNKSLNPMLWANSPSFINNIPIHQSSHVHGIPTSQSHMLNTILPSHHHVGSAPSINPSLWDRRHAYAGGDSMDLRAFHPGSLGRMGLSPISQLHWIEHASHNIFSHSGGNCIDPSISPGHIGIPSPQQRGQMFHGRNPIIFMPGSFDSPTERIRSRRNDTNANQSDNKKQFELDIERIVRGEDSRTTLMIKNIPNKYTSKMLLAAIDENHRGTYDFIYLPIDFKNKCNVGYAFINMINPQHIIPFYQSFNGKKWEKFNSEKVASLAYARIQGKAALIAHFQNSSLMNEDKRCRPILFHTDGPNAGDQEPFPVGTNVKSRSGRSRAVSGSEENHQGDSSTSANGEASCDATVSPPSSTKSDTSHLL
ncbi:hypothetical protein Cni_G06193 [Canna indica]|uniref:RRM domain-containing protein n=1 Tax=Canna indica TaxID=4628 RepID=A0AAQ3Q3U2_9LILI|nr:hypothetical protein Cni_G06193 [Canna indica]